MRRVRALIIASHPGPSLAISAMAALLAAQAAPRGIGPVLAAPAMLAGQLSVGWSNDAADARRDAATGRTDKPAATGAISVRALWIAASAGLIAALAMAAVIGPVAAAITAVIIGAAWAYNAGLKATPASGLAYLAGFGPIPAFATSTLPDHPWPAWPVTAAAAVLGLGAHFANVLPDLAGDRATGVRGLPQLVAARFGPAAVRAAALVLPLLASVLLLAAARPARRWLAIAGLGLSTVLGVIGARSSGRLPFLAAIGIAAIDVALFAAGAEALT
ncbi:MAG TPA: UbiA family prenyltransferase [Streptosporangiaceae bacterium]|jgi:4-hydroxybenzoate polyprenyltransferase